MPKLDVPAGTRFGRLVVTGEAEPAAQLNRERKRRMVCRCDCGGEVIVRLTNLRSGNTTSCGCYRNEMTAARRTTHGQRARSGHTHNYRLWCHIKGRAVTGSSTNADYYLGRGITMYGPWQTDFVAFDTWLKETLGPCPKGQSLDRIDNDGNYEPGNLQWADAETQANNTRSNVWVEYGGNRKTVAQWARHLGMKTQTLWERLFRRNWPIEKAFTPPVRRKQRES